MGKNRNSLDWLADFERDYAIALATASRFVKTLDELVTSKEATAIRQGQERKTPLQVPLAIVYQDKTVVNESLGLPWETVIAYKLVLGKPEEIIMERVTEKRRYVEHKPVGDSYEKEGHITDWSKNGGEENYYLGFGGMAWSKDFYVMDFVPLRKLWFPPNFSAESVKKGLEKAQEKLEPSSGIKNPYLREVAKDIKRCEEYGMLSQPGLESSHYRRVPIEILSIYNIKIFQLSENAFSKLEGICVSSLRKIHF